MSENQNFNENIPDASHGSNHTDSNADQPVIDVKPQVTVSESSKKKHGLRNTLLAVVLLAGCMGSGYVGGMIYGNTSGKNRVVIQQNVMDNTDTATDTTAINTTSGDLTIEQIAAKCKPSVVEIRTEAVQNATFIGNYVIDGAGSGVIISEDGYILTNNHVIEGASSITVTLDDGTSYEATLIGTDDQSDVAVIKIDATDLTPATLGNSDQIVVGETVVAIGNPLGTLGGSVTNGIISATSRNITIDSQNLNVIQTNASVSPGNSGGGLFDAQGNLIGIVNAKSGESDAEGIGFALPINNVMSIATDLMTNGYVTGRPALGVTIQTMSYYNGSSALVVAGFSSNSKAQDAGLQEGDMIVAADGQTISSFADLRGIIQGKSIGDTIELTVIRDNSNLVDVSVPLVEMQNETTTTPEPIITQE